MMHTDSEKFWRELIAAYDGRVHAYIRRTHCSDDQAHQAAWDVWAMAVDREAELMSAEDPWPILKSLLQRRCRERVQVWRHELPYDEPELDALANVLARELPEARWLPPGWAEDALKSLPRMQRLVVDYRVRWGWPYWAVAGGLGTTEGAARASFTRGLKKLQTLAVAELAAARLRDDGPDEGEIVSPEQPM